ncbi:MAG TPA: histidine phosphatase family protein [Alphaproteobacteria bacterium]|nr:histidine phosphatase family protein [Alphaproteobacteria bacterium]
MRNTVYLIRHGENVANITKEFSHRKVDYSLTDKGREQARQTAAYFRGRRLDAVYASPLKRAVETAEPIAALAGLPIHQVEGLREVNIGDLEDERPTPEAWARYFAVADRWKAGEMDARHPGGESLRELQARLRGAVVEALAGRRGQHIAVVAHGGIFAYGLAPLCDDAESAAALIRAQAKENCAITRIEADLEGDRLAVTLHDWASCAHLSGWAAEFVAGVPARG